MPPRPEASMPIALLHRIAREGLPWTIAENSDVEDVRILVLAGHVKASIPLAVMTPAGIEQPPAFVTAITALGRQALAYFPLE